MRHRLLFLVLSLFVATSGLAKLFEEPRSYRLDDKSLDRIDRKVLPRVDVQRLREEEARRGKDRERPQPYRFAVAIDTNFTLANSGTWETLQDGRLWRLRIHSPGATSHNLGITTFEMTRGAKLWIYDPGRKRGDGPYTTRNRNRRGGLWTPVILGDEIVIEVFVPRGVAQPSIEIRKVNQGFRGFLKDDLPNGGTPGNCEIDVVCPEGAGWADPIRAVAVYTLGGVAQCTGTILNNTAIDFTPYFLTANHCDVNDDAAAATVVVYWNFQAPVCGTHTGGSLNDNQSGADHRANNSATDFALIELDQKPNDLGYNVYYAGWDRSGTTPAATVGIHHPQCGVKSISFSTPSSSSANFWRSDWNTPAVNPAVTEPGSSGSCLFDAANQRCIGQLQGGPSFCGASAANLHDFYGKFSVSWTGGGTNATRLSNWLDPGNTGVTSLHGDPHTTTLDGVHYDFQGAGEYVVLRAADSMEIQARMTPIATTFNPGPDPYDGLATCVSLSSAVAARVNNHRVTIQPNLSGVPDPSGLQVRVDGTLVNVGNGIALGPGGRIVRVGSDGYEIDFPNGVTLVATALFWSSQGKWYMNLDVFRGGAAIGMGGASSSSLSTGGIMAAIARGSWLPPLPDGSSMGPMPATLGQRYNDLYLKFGDAWRVTDKTSLFDYAPGTSTETFTFRSWPPANPPCRIPQQPSANPLSQREAIRLCREVTGKTMNADCVFDVRVTGEPGFAKLYLLGQRIRNGATRTTVQTAKPATRPEEPMTFLATVTARTGRRVPTGMVQFLVDGERMGDPVRLDDRGQATWMTAGLSAGKHSVTARYIPAKDSPFVASSSFDHTVSIGSGLR